jgi:hypothetical protein
MTRFLTILALAFIVAAPAVYIIGRLAWHIAEVLP